MTFEEDIIAGPVMVEGDRDALHRLFLILIDNAVKYTPPNGVITVSLANGSGFADKARSRELGGVGLGLSIARWETEALGGSIEIESTVGRGSLFQVRLPLIKS